MLACYADEGPTMRRFRPRARGRATRIRKRSCHITVVVARLSDDRLEVLQSRQQTQSAGRRTRRGGTAQSRRDRSSAAVRGPRVSGPAPPTRPTTCPISIPLRPPTAVRMTPSAAEPPTRRTPRRPTRTLSTPTRSSSATSTRSWRTRPPTRRRRTSPTATWPRTPRRRARYATPTPSTTGRGDRAPRWCRRGAGGWLGPGRLPDQGQRQLDAVPRAERPLLRRHDRRGVLRHPRARRGRWLRGSIQGGNSDAPHHPHHPRRHGCDRFGRRPQSVPAARCTAPALRRGRASQATA